MWPWIRERSTTPKRSTLTSAIQPAGASRPRRRYGDSSSGAARIYSAARGRHPLSQEPSVVSHAVVHVPQDERVHVDRPDRRRSDQVLVPGDEDRPLLVPVSLA